MWDFMILNSAPRGPDCII